MHRKLLAILISALVGATTSAKAADSTASSTSVTVSSSTGSESALQTQSQTLDSLSASQGQTTVTNKIASDFTSFAGSTENAQALVTGLRTGSSITLSGLESVSGTTSNSTSGSSTAVTVTTAPSVTFTPPTGSMGNGNVYISLALAKQQLAAMGITQPTPEQIQAALMGGTLTTSTGTTLVTQEFQGVLQLRSSGMGWGQIAKSLGTKLGPVIAGMRSGNANLASKATTTATATTSQTTVVGKSTHSKSGSMTSALGKSGSTGQHSGKSKASTYYADTHSGIVTASGAAAGRVHGSYSSGKGGGYTTHQAAGAATGSGIVTASGGSRGGGSVHAGGNGKALGQMK